MQDAVIVELPIRSGNEFLDLLERLPEGFASVNMALEFHNGPLPHMEQKRTVKPDTTFYKESNAVTDETDYIKSTGWFYPGFTLVP